MVTKEITDSRGLFFLPLRKPFSVVSLVPSWTETLFGLGLTEIEILGRTRYCIHPKTRVSRLEDLGGPRDPNLAKIIELDPDLVLADREENRREDVEVMDRQWPAPRVFVTDPYCVRQVFKHIEELGFLLGKPERARQLVLKVRSWMARVNKVDRGTVVYLVWQDPFMAASRETYIGDILEMLGYRNIFDQDTTADLDLGVGVRYPTLNRELLADLKPQSILLSTEPFPFKKKHVEDLRSNLSRLDRAYGKSVRMHIVNGEYFSWYGRRMIPAFRYFVKHWSTG
jgi:ABC-type Fe3+-hydroxamate transport system substrate-binding protein